MLFDYPSPPSHIVTHTTGMAHLKVTVWIYGMKINDDDDDDDDDDCDRRMDYGDSMLGWHEDWPKLFENILWSDETVFHIGAFVYRHNCHYWAAHDPEVMVEKMQNRPKVTVWCGMTATRVIGPYLLRGTMNAERYLQMLEDYVWPIVSGWENIDELVFMHDDAPSHAMRPYSHLKRYM